MAKQPAWTADEIADLRTIAADTTLTWAEVAAAIAARDPNRPRRTPLAVRLCASKLRLPVRTDDARVPLQPGYQPGRAKADKAPAPEAVAAGARVAARIPTESEVRRALTVWTEIREARAAGEGWGTGYVEGLVRGRAEVLDALRALLDVYKETK
ncbi:MAG: hypothetical protein EBX36_08525 [Planctomycetia bacterium]|nr:hypothetical protein [Planctomycetia bacterium]